MLTLPIYRYKILYIIALSLFLFSMCWRWWSIWARECHVMVTIDLLRRKFMAWIIAPHSVLHPFWDPSFRVPHTSELLPIRSRSPSSIIKGWVSLKGLGGALWVAHVYATIGIASNFSQRCPWASVNELHVSRQDWITRLWCVWRLIVWGSIDIEIDYGIGFVWSELGNLLLRNDQVVCDIFFFTIKVSISQAI